MSAFPGSQGTEANPEWGIYLPIVGGLLLLFLPTFYKLAGWHWQSEEGGHGPIILAILVWLCWRERGSLADVGVPALVPGIGLLVVGLLLYVVGRSLDIALFEVGALLPILAGTLIAMRGWRVLRRFWFPLLFLIFLVPIPETFAGAMTVPLKQRVSEIAEVALYAAGYPVARTGVVLTIGQYQLLVADACSGLQSMVSLSALGLLYMHMTARASVLHNVAMLASILPIAFAANVVRVTLLMLITYHFGDAAGQGFLHGATGIFLILLSLFALMLVDGVLLRVLPPPRLA